MVVCVVLAEKDWQSEKRTPTGHAGGAVGKDCDRETLFVLLPMPVKSFCPGGVDSD